MLALCFSDAPLEIIAACGHIGVCVFMGPVILAHPRPMRSEHQTKKT
jgi:hypothetical protein